MAKFSPVRVFQDCGGCRTLVKVPPILQAPSETRKPQEVTWAFIPGLPGPVSMLLFTSRAWIRSRSLHSATQTHPTNICWTLTTWPELSSERIIPYPKGKPQLGWCTKECEEKTLGSVESDKFGFKSQLCYCLTVWPQKSLLAFRVSASWSKF